jgi:hypothetical protein
VVHEIPAECLPVRREMNRPTGAIGRGCRACARNFCQEPSEVNTSREPGIADAPVKCLAHSAPPHFHFDVRAHLNANLPDRLTGRASDNDSPLLTCPPWSPDLTSYDFFLWGYIKDRVYVPLMPRDL